MSHRLSQSDRARRGLRSLILSGAFSAGDRVPEVAVSERLGLSRTPVRQAMDRLVEEGLLERSPGGCRVARFTSTEIRDAIEVRGVIEGTAARLAAERGTDPALIAEAERAIDAMDAALAGRMDFDAYVAGNALFHDTLARMPASDVIRREVQRTASRPLASPSAFLNDQELIPHFHDSLRRAQDHHRAILSAIRDREGTRAEAIAREHARLARQNLDHLLNANPEDVARVPGLALVSRSEPKGGDPR